MPDWSKIFTYDIETYPNVFSCGFQRADNGHRWIFEISERGNQAQQLCEFMWNLRTAECRMMGFNNEGFDYPVLHHLYSIFCAKGSTSVDEIYQKAMAIIGSPRNDFTHSVWESDRIVPQIDLFKIKHFDNFARSTSLKKLEIAMRSHSVEDLPYAPGTFLTADQIPVLNQYMAHDISETTRFALTQADQIDFRDELTEKYGRDFTNFNDTRIGKQHFTDELEQAGVECFTRINGRREKNQTPRPDGIKVGEKLLPVPFSNHDLQQMWQFFNNAIIPPDKTKGFFTDLSVTVDGFKYDFGAGGIHGSVHRRSFWSNDTHMIVDVDVTSYYPSLAIVNRFYPEHLGDTFCDIYAALKEERVNYPKGSAQNAMLKLALNGVYGDSNNKYSVFYDPAYTMAITINGQLLLAWLAEMCQMQPDFELIQINTDGLTLRLPRAQKSQLDAICEWWMSQTDLDLEEVEYRSMHVRDVNNYVAIDMNGKVKRKNAYLTEPDWHQDHSSLVIPKAVDAFLRQGTRIDRFIFAHTDPFDFMRHIKVPRSSRLMHGDRQVQNVSRYYFSRTGHPLVKVMPPLADQTEERQISVDKDWKVDMCNVATDFDWAKLNYLPYVQEAEKLVEGLGLNCLEPPQTPAP